MQIQGATVLVTGANRGVGAAFVDELIARGAAKVYAAARAPHEAGRPGVEPIVVDITDAAQVAAAARAATDVTLLINNAGVSTYAPLVTGEPADVRLEMETNYFGTLSMVRAFAPVLAANGGGAILNVSSVMAWLPLAHSNGYGASKAAVWALTNGIRTELAGQGTQVTGLAMASTDTEMMAAFDVPKNPPSVVAIAALDGVEHGDTEVLADADTRAVKATIADPPAVPVSL